MTLLLGLLAAASGNCVFAAAQPTAILDSKTGQIVLTSGRMELTVDTQGGANPCGMRDLKSGRVYVDGDYAWPKDAHSTMKATIASDGTDGAARVVIQGKVGSLDVTQTFTASAKEPDAITEQITLHNPTDKLVENPGFYCGFTKKIHDGKNWLAGMAESRFSTVPYRRRTDTGEICDYALPELDAKKVWYSAERTGRREESWIYGSEGWAWYQGGNTLLITKYNPDAPEWTLMETTPKGAAAGTAKSLWLGGAGQWKLGDPEGAARLAPGATFAFGETRYQALDGDWRQAFSPFRRYMASKGHVVPPGYNPPVHWNELYDNKYWWNALDKGFTAENLKKHYQKKDMEIEAEKAKEIGCECLYLDPGWDTVLGSNVWAEDRLGTQASFVAWLKDKYGLKLALHTPVAPWSDPTGYPAEARRMDKAGKRLDELCPSSPAYIEAKVSRLKELCKHGACFLMYDGSWFPGECWDKTHGHSLPVTHQEHLAALLKMQQEVHKDYPNVLIEQHDPMLGPNPFRYTPTYFMHAKPGAFDELWGYEYMWDPMADLLSGRGITLYYVNLAYNIPIYLHINLNNDNDQALAFWWYASTCRHLGIGGKHKNPAIWEAHKRAMKTYLSLKRFYTQGVFYGLDETVHAHTLPDLRESVLNVFNLTDKPEEKEVRFRLADIGLPTGPIKVDGASFTEKEGEIMMKIKLPAHGHQLIKITSM